MKQPTNPAERALLVGAHAPGQIVEAAPLFKLDGKGVLYAVRKAGGTLSLEVSPPTFGLTTRTAPRPPLQLSAREQVSEPIDMLEAIALAARFKLAIEFGYTKKPAEGSVAVARQARSAFWDHVLEADDIEKEPAKAITPPEIGGPFEERSLRATWAGDGRQWGKGAVFGGIDRGKWQPRTFRLAGVAWVRLAKAHPLRGLGELAVAPEWIETRGDYALIMREPGHGAVEVSYRQSEDRGRGVFEPFAPLLFSDLPERPLPHEPEYAKCPGHGDKPSCGRLGIPSEEAPEPGRWYRNDKDRDLAARLFCWACGVAWHGTDAEVEEANQAEAAYQAGLEAEGQG